MPLPEFLALDDRSYNCPPLTAYNDSSAVETCCVLNPNYVPDPVNATGFLKRRSGDLIISYDVLQSHGSSYLALVTLENNNPFGRLDHWQLSWEWARGEFIYMMNGAYPTVVDASDCIFGQQSQYYQDMDFSKVLSFDALSLLGNILPIYKEVIAELKAAGASWIQFDEPALGQV